MISVTVVLLLIIGAINILNYQSIIADVDERLDVLNENDGDFPDFKPSGGVHTQIDNIFNYPEAKYENIFFSLIYEDGEFTVDNRHNTSVSISEATDIAKKIILLNKDRGFYGIVGTTRVYRYLISDTEDGRRFIFLDCTISIENYYRFLGLSLAISAASLLAIFIMMVIFAAKIISPIAESYEKQKRFITNAGHDIKTPITIIDADREILEMDIGENEWLDDIRKQTKRLTRLTNDLIYLSRMEEGTDIKELSTFSISNVFIEEADSFSAVAVKRELEIVTDVEENIDINGSEEDVRKLLAILFDNAIKYGKPGTNISAKMRRHGRIATVTISNVAENMTEEQTKKMFDRFFRADRARGSDGGFGIGLATAQAIVHSHNGKISADLSPDKILSISASFPTQFGSFRLITNLGDKTPKNVNNNSQNDDVSNKNGLLKNDGVLDENEMLAEFDIPSEDGIIADTDIPSEDEIIVDTDIPSEDGIIADTAIPSEDGAIKNTDIPFTDNETEKFDEE